MYPMAEITFTLVNTTGLSIILQIFPTNKTIKTHVIKLYCYGGPYYPKWDFNIVIAGGPCHPKQANTLTHKKMKFTFSFQLNDCFKKI